ncbi:glycosyltransferase family 2 protein [Devosia nitrariae]|uniref:Glycosyl transferase family A n=1 Tax=Devosia nitrariae TaxID=2071872 RepID=A0ABQ5WDV3_9HYPH|nr:glycosyltransferase family 2 protein [Devosia nitrariae]GLQ57971.1 glycosyl transferase family A [Devosia nitrariae]
MLQAQPPLEASPRPLVSVIMANYQAGRRIARALESVLNQTVCDLEVIISDDASGDESLALAREAALRDARVHLIEAEANAGPARSRNRALAQARGEWIAIVDSDDMIHPERFERLLAAARHFSADIVADNLLHFHEDGTPTRFLLGEGQRRPFRVSAEDWILAGYRPGTAPLGYLKPLIRASVLGDTRYDETLRIGEDYDLLLRLLLTGASLQVVPEPWYLYRRHSGSISHRLSIEDVAAMIDNQRRLVEREGPFPALVAAALEERMQRLEHSHAYERLVARIKQRDAIGALALLARRPRLASNLWRSLDDRRRRPAPVAVHQAPPRAEGVLLLGGMRSPQAPASHRIVPPYKGHADMDWMHPSPREVWAELADLGNGRDLKVVCNDPAGIYAAGFIPADRLTLVTTDGAAVAAGPQPRQAGEAIG